MLGVVETIKQDKRQDMERATENKKKALEKATAGEAFVNAIYSAIEQMEKKREEEENKEAVNLLLDALQGRSIVITNCR